MRSYFYNLTKGEISLLKENCNYTKDEELLIDLICKRKSDVEIADKFNICTSTVTKRKHKLLLKTLDFVKGIDGMTVCFINGKSYTPEELVGKEIKLEKVRELLSDKLHCDSINANITAYNPTIEKGGQK